MISSGSEPGDEGYDEWLEYTQDETRLDAAQEDYESGLIEAALKDLYRERGAKTGAANKNIKEDRVRRLQSEADAIWAESPQKSIKDVARIIYEKNPVGSSETIKRMIKKPPAI